MQQALNIDRVDKKITSLVTVYANSETASFINEHKINMARALGITEIQAKVASDKIKEDYYEQKANVKKKVIIDEDIIGSEHNKQSENINGDNDEIILNDIIFDDSLFEEKEVVIGKEEEINKVNGEDDLIVPVVNKNNEENEETKEEIKIYRVDVERAAGKECSRCRCMRMDVGRHKSYPDICLECSEILEKYKDGGLDARLRRRKINNY